MNNIFPSNGRNPSPLINMPDMYSGRIPIREPIQQIPIQQEPGLQQIARQSTLPIQKEQVLEPMGSAYDPPESDKFATRIIMGETPKDKELALKTLVAGQKGNIEAGKFGLMIAKQKLAEKIASGKATDKEKHDYRMIEIEERGDITSDQINQRGNIVSGQIKERGNITDRQIQERGNITGQQIDQREQNFRSRPITASQQGNDQSNKIRQLMLTRPDLAQHVTEDTGGRISIKEDTPLELVSQINDMIYPRNINLPSNKDKKSSNPTTKTGKPSAAELLKKYGG